MGKVKSSFFKNIWSIISSKWPTQLANIENFVKEVLDYLTKIKDSTNKPGIILTTWVKYIELNLIKNAFNSIDKFNEIKEFKRYCFFLIIKLKTWNFFILSFINIKKN